MNRSIAVLIAALVTSGPSTAASDAGDRVKSAQPVPVAVLVPVCDPAVPEGLGLAIAERANSKLLRTGHYAVLHARQVLAAADRHRVATAEFANPAAARTLAERTGAQTFAYATLKAKAPGFTFSISVGHVGDAGDTTTTIDLPRGEAIAVEAAASALAAATAKLDGLTPEDDAPTSTQDTAMREYAACAAKLIQQPIGIENPTLLAEAELALAVKACEAAVKADPQFSRAWATLALASAIAGDDARAIEALGRVKVSSAYLSNAVLARFWLVSRYQSDAAAEVVLTDTIAREPGQLLTRTYLAEYYGALGRWNDAARAWQAFATLVPKSPFALSRLAYALSRLGQSDEAAVLARRAIAFDPDSPELILELASRQIDAGQLDAAEATLGPLAKSPKPRAEVLLRYGYLKQKQGKTADAKRFLASAMVNAKDKREWRTRARARVNLAQLALVAGDNAGARKLVLESLQDGLQPPLGEPVDPKSVWALVTEQEVSGSLAKGVAKRKEATPLPGLGSATGAARQAPPQGFDGIAVKTPAAP